MGPGISPGRSSRLVGLADLTPTILEYLGIEYNLSTTGKSILSSFTNDANTKGLVYSAARLDKAVENQWRMLRTENWSYGRLGRSTMLYDRVNDRFENNNIANSQKDIADRLDLELRSFAESIAKRYDSESPELEEQEKQTLRGQGYVK